MQESLEEGDVISLTSNVAGTRINHMYFIYRPQDEDIITGSQDFGTDFEKLNNRKRLKCCKSMEA